MKVLAFGCCLAGVPVLTFAVLAIAGWAQAVPALSGMVLTTAGGRDVYLPLAP